MFSFSFYFYKKSPKSSLEIFRQFDVAFINFFNASKHYFLVDKIQNT